MQQNTQKLDSHIEEYDKCKSDINFNIMQTDFKLKELRAREGVIEEEITSNQLRLSERVIYLEKLNHESQLIEDETLILNSEINSMNTLLENAIKELQKEKEYYRQKIHGENPPPLKRESVFSTNYAVQIVQGERKTLLKQTLAPQQNGNVEQTKPYCSLI